MASASKKIHWEDGLKDKPNEQEPSPSEPPAASESPSPQEQSPESPPPQQQSPGPVPESVVDIPRPASEPEPASSSSSSEPPAAPESPSPQEQSPESPPPQQQSSGSVPESVVDIPRPASEPEPASSSSSSEQPAAPESTPPQELSPESPPPQVSPESPPELVVDIPRPSIEPVSPERRIQVENAVKQAKDRINHLFSPKNEEETESVFRKKMNRFFDTVCLVTLQHSMSKFYKNVCSMKPWRNELIEIEGKFGSAAFLTFAFLRFVFLLNALLSILWIVCIIIPFFVRPPSSFTWSKFFHTGFLNFFQGKGLEKSWIFYGGYYYTTEEQSGWYKVTYIYPCVIIASLLVSWIVILTRITKQHTVSSKIAVKSNKVSHPFCAMVFGSWDFRIRTKKAASRLRKNIRMKCREMLADVSDIEKRITEEKTKTKRILRYVSLCVLWPFLIASNITIVVFLVSKAEDVNKKFGTGYAQSTLLAANSILPQFMIPFLVTMQDWTPATSEKVILVKYFTLRLVNTCTLFYRLYLSLSQATNVQAGNQSFSCIGGACAQDGFTCCNPGVQSDWVTCPADQVNSCLPGCMENVVAIQLLRLMLASTFTSIGCDLVFGVLHRLIFRTRKQLSIEIMVIEIVYYQALTWVGCSFSPVAPIVALFCNFAKFMYMRFALKVFYGAMKKPYSASKTSNLSYGLLLLALVLCTLPASATLVNISSGICGPIRQGTSMYTTLIFHIKQAPTVLRVILEWFGSPSVLLGIILVLVFAIISMREKQVEAKLESRAKYSMFTTYCLLNISDEEESQKIRELLEQVQNS